MKESDDLIEIVLKKSQNGLKGFDPHSIVMEATANTGFAFTVGYSMKQGTQQLHDTVVELDNAIGQLLNLSNYKLIFTMLPQYIRKFIPLKYWPSEYQYDGPKLNIITIFQHRANLLVGFMILYLTASIDMLR